MIRFLVLGKFCLKNLKLGPLNQFKIIYFIPFVKLGIWLYIIIIKNYVCRKTFLQYQDNEIEELNSLWSILYYCWNQNIKYECVLPKWEKNLNKKLWSLIFNSRWSFISISRKSYNINSFLTTWWSRLSGTF